MTVKSLSNKLHSLEGCRWNKRNVSIKT